MIFGLKNNTLKLEWGNYEKNRAYVFSLNYLPLLLAELLIKATPNEN